MKYNQTYQTDELNQDIIILEYFLKLLIIKLDHIHRISVCVCVNCAGVKRADQAFNRFSPCGSEQSQLPCNNMYLLKIFAPTDPVIMFGPKGSVRTGVTQRLVQMSQRGELSCLPSFFTWKV